jgi:hypothetical protein
MTNDFVEAFNKGQELAADASRALKEVISQIQQMSVEIAGATDGKIEIGVFRKSVPPIHKFLFVMANISKVLEDKELLADKQPPKIIIGVRKQESSESIAEIDFSDTGYPCNLMWRTNLRVCADEEEVISGLKDVISDPVISKILSEIMILDETRLLKESNDKSDDEEEPTSK